MTCENCGGSMIGDGITTPLHCEFVDEPHHAPDSSPAYCTQVIHIRDATPNDVYVGRPSKWGNPFMAGPHGTRAEVINKYRSWIVQKPDLLLQLHELRGKRLACWCHPQACHADVLLELIECTQVGGKWEDVLDQLNVSEGPGDNIYVYG